MSKASSLFTAAPHRLHYYLALPPVKSAIATDSHRSTAPTLNCVCEGARLLAPYEEIMPDDLSLHYGELYNYFNILV